MKREIEQLKVDTDKFKNVEYGNLIYDITRLYKEMAEFHRAIIRMKSADYKTLSPQVISMLEIDIRYIKGVRNFELHFMPNFNLTMQPQSEYFVTVDDFDEAARIVDEYVVDHKDEMYDVHLTYEQHNGRMKTTAIYFDENAKDAYNQYINASDLTSDELEKINDDLARLISSVDDSWAVFEVVEDNNTVVKFLDCDTQLLYSCCIKEGDTDVYIDNDNGPIKILSIKDFIDEFLSTNSRDKQFTIVINQVSNSRILHHSTYFYNLSKQEDKDEN